MSYDRRGKHALEPSTVKGGGTGSNQAAQATGATANAPAHSASMSEHVDIW
jgi:hypothetical protein